MGANGSGRGTGAGLMMLGGREAGALAALLAGAQGAQGPAEPNKPAHEVAEAMVRTLSGDCGCEAHKHLGPGMLALLRASFKVDTLPRRVREPFLAAIVSMAVHADHDDGPANAVATLLNRERFADLTMVALAVAKACGVATTPSDGSDGEAPAPRRDGFGNYL